MTRDEWLKEHRHTEKDVMPDDEGREYICRDSASPDVHVVCEQVLYLPDEIQTAITSGENKV